MTYMGIVRHGIDMVDCNRIGQMVERHGMRFLNRVFTPREIDYCKDRRRFIEHLAGRFAAKEAVLKVLGTGWRNGIQWTDVEIVNESSGKPRIILNGKCLEIARAENLGEILVSISHISTHAIASAIASTSD